MGHPSGLHGRGEDPRRRRPAVVPGGGGRPVAMAGVSPVVAGQARVAPVHTPPELRGRGHAGAASVAATRLAQRSGASEVLLFTDPADPTRNALHQRLGYRPVTDHLELVVT
ncbi:GNAT family N-acetyltransferase [Streptomyces sp. NPDC001970]